MISEQKLKAQLIIRKKYDSFGTSDDIAADLVVTDEFGQKHKFTARFDEEDAIIYLSGKGGGS